MEMLTSNKQIKIKISKREAVSCVKKTASMLARFYVPSSKRNELEMDADNQIITPMQLLEQITLGFELPLKSKHKKDCLDALNDVIEKKYKGVSRELIYG